MEMDMLTKPASTHPHLPSTHMIPVLQKNPQLWGWREGGRWGSRLCTAGLQHQGPCLGERQNLLLMENKYTL